MLKLPVKIKSDSEWSDIFSNAKYGHTLWDGWANDPHNPIHAIKSSRQFVQHAQQYGFFKKGNKILDIGCGNGRFGIVFADMYVSYLGIDPVKNCIDFCEYAFKDYRHLKFKFEDIYNECFNPSGAIKPEDYKIDLPDNSVDDIIVYSIFTHLQNEETAQNYMKEIKRVLKIGGKLFCSWYRSPPNKMNDPFVGRTVYNEWFIMSIMNGFKFDFTYGGHTDAYYDQWAMFCTKL